MTPIKNSVIYLFLWLLPKNFISYLMGVLVSLRLPKPMARLVNKSFARWFGINLAEAARPIEEYACLQDFFIRRLKADARPIDRADNVIISPCDGTMSQAGPIKDGQLIQVKGRNYSLRDLVKEQELVDKFHDGYYATIYLSPKDYHRFHMPIDGEITKTLYWPGALWPVNNWAVKNIANLFCINERIISLIKPDSVDCRMAHIAVGATMVGKIKLAYCPLESNKTTKAAILEHENQKAVKLKKGSDLGKFMFGSTIVLLFDKESRIEFRLAAPGVVKMGQAIAKIN